MPRRRASALKPAIAAIALWQAMPASADDLKEGNVELDWQAPASCPGAGVVLERVRALLAHSEQDHGAVRARAVVTQPTPDGLWELTLETVEGAHVGRRSVTAASCNELVEAGALIVALAIDPGLGGPAEPSRPAATPPASVASANALVAEPAAASSGAPAPAPPPSPSDGARLRERQRRSGLRVGAAAAAVLDVGSLPRATSGAEAGLFLELAPVRLELVGLGLPRVRKVIAEDPERGGEIELWSGGARGCAVFRRERMVLGPCIGFEGGVVRGSGFGATAWRSSESSRWLAGRVGGLTSVRLTGPLALRSVLDVGVPAVRPEFYLERVGRVHRATPVVARAGLGLELTLP